jgi:PAS domain S-box-containing protein
MLNGVAYCRIITDERGKPIDYIYLDVNDAFARNIGFKRESILDKKATEVQKRGAITEDWLSMCGRVALTGDPVISEVYIKEMKKWFHVSVYSPQKGYFVSNSEDITERKRLESEIESIARFPSENPNPIFRIDGNGTILYGNIASDSLLAVWNSKVDKRAPEHIIQTAVSALASNKRIELEETFGAKTLTLLFAPINSVGYVNIYANDITERKKAEEALAESEQKYRTIVDTAAEGIAITKPEGNHIFVNNRLAQMLGYSTDELLKKSSFDLMSEEEQKRQVSQMRKDLQDNQIQYREFEFRRKDGSVFWVACNASPMFESDGKHVANIAMFSDITERKKAEEEIVVSEKRYRRLFETSQDGIMARDLEGRMIDCNQAYSRMLGYSKTELKTLSANDLLPEKWWEQREKVVKEVLETGGSIVFEREYRRRDGVVFPASVRTWRLTDEKGNIIGTWSIVRDITQQKELQEKLQRYATHLEQLVEERTKQLKDSERLAAIGATAGMVGHDIRNPLQAITGDVYLAKTELASTPESEEKKNALESLQEIEKNIDYINKIVADLQDFARPLKPHAEEADLKIIIDELLKKNGLPENVKLSVKVEKYARKIVADSSYINRILYNLVTNAVQAMPKGGKLTIHAYKEAKDIFITVKDTGIGIPEVLKDKLFTPMFTTKAKGQGFGLAVIKRMTESLGGTVTFESQEGKGTTFTVRLPTHTSDKR